MTSGDSKQDLNEFSIFMLSYGNISITLLSHTSLPSDWSLVTSPHVGYYGFLSVHWAFTYPVHTGLPNTGHIAPTLVTTASHLSTEQ